ncbi:hypothetical protein R8871_00185 [Paraburkholderia graminis C4D1M]|jgi:hypothetical protein|uniref:Uncharacterized protein n=1 Tax=Paraburkholderia graminis (strain ATCC 700544 / DSM 17151 / LMG 18924 / NCIMB 13744 / C4D1M) TaxID=396598 RepID=B1FZ86_PARG4|nr:hypothetical protein BgramDRAFT_2423 [Paraburkholderia graminis C4D1M]CAB3639889.1 hypothetical protein R8871_00185 [Paraburkholderia graminis C4D1M]
MSLRQYATFSLGQRRLSASKARVRPQASYLRMAAC